MKNSEKIWNLLQSPNTFEMGMELLETMVGIDPEIPYELFTQHSALEWFQNHKNVRFPQLILDCFLSIWESGDAAYADCLTDTHSLSLGGVRQISQGHLDLFQNMPNLTLSVDWQNWLKLSNDLPGTLVVNTFQIYMAKKFSFGRNDHNQKIMVVYTFIKPSAVGIPSNGFPVG